MAVNLPLRGDLYHFEFLTVLDGVTYGFEFRWHGREASWYVNISDSEGDRIYDGAKVLIGIPLFVPSQ